MRERSRKGREHLLPGKTLKPSTASQRRQFSASASPLSWDTQRQSCEYDPPETVLPRLTGSFQPPGGCRCLAEHFQSKTENQEAVARLKEGWRQSRKVTELQRSLMPSLRHSKRGSGPGFKLFYSTTILGLLDGKYHQPRLFR